jgi:hypothetical protein
MSDASRLHRAKAAILGAICADAACRPLHWVYDTDAIKRYVIELSPLGNPEFLPDNRSPFYSVPTGELSPYGGALLASLEGAVLASAPDAAAVAAGIEQSLIATFGADDSPWQTSYRQRKVVYDEKNKWVTPDFARNLPKLFVGVCRPTAPAARLEWSGTRRLKDPGLTAAYCISLKTSGQG